MRLIEHVEAEGLHVKVQHYRLVNNEYMGGLLHTTSQARAFKLKHGTDVNPRGGRTVVKLVDDADHVVAEGVAECCRTDNYSKQRGILIALSRALCAAERGVPQLGPVVHRTPYWGPVMLDGEED